MSEYYLADHKATERARQRERERELKEQPKAQDVKVTLLGDFMFPSNESPGCDPYNSTQGKSVPEPWGARRDRR
jgi:hypothetical protein